MIELVLRMIMIRSRIQIFHGESNPYMTAAFRVVCCRTCATGTSCSVAICWATNGIMPVCDTRPRNGAGAMKGASVSWMRENTKADEIRGQREVQRG
jgi:hypothetical protein